MKYLFLIVMFFLIACPVIDYRWKGIEIKNNSDSTIFVYSTCSDSIQLIPELKFHELLSIKLIDKNGKTIDSIIPEYIIYPDSIGYTQNGLSDQYGKIDCDNKQITLFFIKKSTMLNFSWNEIYKKQIFVKKRQYTQEELDRLNWTITYP